QYVGEWHVLPIGLHADFINHVNVKYYLVEKADIKPSLKKRNKFQHKGHFGHALLVAGAYGKTGAAVLAAKACLRTGPGLLTTHIPKAGYPIIQTAVPEAMTVIDSSEHIFSETGDIAPFNAIGVGPAIGMEKQTQNALKLLIQNSSVPLLFDADAINILGENKTWISFVPKGSIFTPHPKEFERLTEKAANDFERNQLQREFAVKYGVYVVLKGYHTSVACPDGSCYFNTTGNPGMATGGSGDILTGIILGFMAQGYSPKESAIIGVYLHGLAGDLAAEERGYEALIPSDMVEMLGAGFKILKE
ncbi:MAG: NAD(P)H-hydrate dehydratase, partial [Bacteroidales bacterium]|nr:NAD(P)H-hydrate dehydratase [Bacteroidales bacterium]